MVVTIALYTLAFLYLTNWLSINYFVKALFDSTKVLTEVEDAQLQKSIYKKTRLNLTIKVLQVDRYAGFLTLIPHKTIVVTQKVYKDFDKDEIEWLILHEIGHYVHSDLIKYVLLTLPQVSLGVYILMSFNSLSVFILLVIQVLVQFQLLRYTEYKADSYALNKMDNPEGMISANEKFIKSSKSFIYKSKILTFLLTPHLSREFRIKMAQKKINNSLKL